MLVYRMAADTNVFAVIVTIAVAQELLNGLLAYA
jgi:hypothetical protein